jgi:hypothetical protein
VYSGKTEASEISPVQVVSSYPPEHTGGALLDRSEAGLSERTDGSRLDHVADGESLDRLVLGCASRAVGAADGLDVAATLLVTAAVVVLVLHVPPYSPFRYCILGRSLLDHVGLILTIRERWFRNVRESCGVPKM